MRPTMHHPRERPPAEGSAAPAKSLNRYLVKRCMRRIRTFSSDLCLREGFSAMAEIRPEACARIRCLTRCNP